ncbi:hypothetical protein G5C51_09020 [Streptomyces sp. A7024]|uniref:Secreted protein n=1 Tax=Streptomyces coryli TaxID=1128680 RepID=A0A6G4TX73_9ACTN|nr:hypothetical protein [Streptomyces coryli]NGN64046.1 hypothetical protein [Streptomyces coryli]
MRKPLARTAAVLAVAGFSVLGGAAAASADDHDNFATAHDIDVLRDASILNNSLNVTDSVNNLAQGSSDLVDVLTVNPVVTDAVDVTDSVNPSDTADLNESPVGVTGSYK